MNVSEADLNRELATLRSKVSLLEREKSQQSDLLEKARLLIGKLQRDLALVKIKSGSTEFEEVGYDVCWPWSLKVRYILLKTGIPLRPVDISNELHYFDGALAKKKNPVAHLNAVLRQAARAGRVIPYKHKDIVGNFYALPEWLAPGIQLS